MREVAQDESTSFMFWMRLKAKIEESYSALNIYCFATKLSQKVCVKYDYRWTK